MATQIQNGVVSFTAGEALTAFRAVRRTAASGTNVQYCDANETPEAIVQVDAANAAEVACRLLSDPGTFKITAAGAFAAGDKLFPAADGKFDDDSTTGGPAVLVALEAAAADNDVVEALPLSSGWTGSRLLFSAAAASAEVENTVTETAFATSYTVPVLELEVGDVIEVLSTVTVNDNNSTDTLTIRLKAGTEVIHSPAAFDAADNDIVQHHAFIRINTLGATGNVKAHGIFTAGVPGTAVPTPFVKAAAVEDISAGVLISVTAEWSVAHADNEVELTDLTIIHHRQ